MSLLRVPMESYKGLHIGCAPGTHAALVEMILRHVSARSGVLDIGAHAGALLQRLRDHGFSDLFGTDLDSTVFKLPEAQFKRIELNQSFSREFDRKFDLITSTDVIEHLDSPRNFLGEARKLLNENGHLAISLPNVAFWEGRVKFALKGELWGFGERNYRTQRHISPMTVEMLGTLAQEVGFTVVEYGTAGSFASPLRATLGFPLWAPFRLIGGRTSLGESLLFLFRKGEPVGDLKRPIHYRQRWSESETSA